MKTTKRINLRRAFFGGAALASMLGGIIFTGSNPVQAQNQGNGFSIVLEEVGEIPAPEGSEIRTADVTNPTGIQVVNETDLDLYYGLNYGNFKEVEIAANATKNHFGQKKLAAAGWDKDLRRPHIQLNIKLLKPGYKYAFRQK